MSRRRGGWDEDLYGGGQRPRPRDEGPEFRPRRDEGTEFRPPRGYEYDERERPRGGHRFGPRGDYHDAFFGRGDFSRDKYYAARRPDERDLKDEGTYELGRRRSRATRSHL